MITINNTKQEIFDAYEALLRENEDLKTDTYVLGRAADIVKAKKMPFVEQKLRALLK